MLCVVAYPENFVINADAFVVLGFFRIHLFNEP